MKSSLSSGFRLAPRAALASLFCAALAASTAVACPPGTMPDPNYNPAGPAAKAHPQRCVPAPKPAAAKYSGPVNPGVEHADRPHSPTTMQLDRSKVRPQSGAPIEHAGGRSDANGIIFVGGKNAINSQPVPPGKTALNPQPIPPGNAALNTQPIPPGRTVRPAPQPGLPIEKPLGH